MAVEQDIFLKLKFAGLCLSRLPPPEAGEATYADFLRHVKFFLAKKTNRLLKDPVWDSYLDEELLVEYWAHRFSDHQGDPMELLIPGFKEQSDEEWMFKEAARLDQEAEKGDILNSEEFKIQDVCDALLSQDE